MRSYISLAALLATAALCPAQVLHPDVKDRATESAGNNNNNGGNN